MILRLGLLGFKAKLTSIGYKKVTFPLEPLSVENIKRSLGIIIVLKH
jgi:hypothetical protein